MLQERGENYQSWAILSLYVDKSVSADLLINGTALIFNFKNVNLTEECLLLNLLKAWQLKFNFVRIF